MSRVAKKPVHLPKGVECQVKSDTITVKGPKGSLSMAPLRGVAVTTTLCTPAPCPLCPCWVISVGATMAVGPRYGVGAT